MRCKKCEMLMALNVFKILSLSQCTHGCQQSNKRVIIRLNLKLKSGK